MTINPDDLVSLLGKAPEVLEQTIAEIGKFDLSLPELVNNRTTLRRAIIQRAGFTRKSFGKDALALSKEYLHSPVHPEGRSNYFAIKQKHELAKRIHNIPETNFSVRLSKDGQLVTKVGTGNPLFSPVSAGAPMPKGFGNFKMIWGKRTQDRIFQYYKSVPQNISTSAIQYLNTPGLSRAAKLRMATWMESNDLSHLYGYNVAAGAKSATLRTAQQTFETAAAEVYKIDELIQNYSDIGATSKELELIKAQLSRTKASLAQQSRKLGVSHKIKATDIERASRSATNTGKVAKELRQLRKLLGVQLDKSGRVRLLSNGSGLLNVVGSDEFASKYLLRHVNRSMGKLAAKSGLILFGASVLTDVVNSLTKTAINVSNKFNKKLSQLSSTDFGNGRALTTQMVSTEREQAVKIIRSNKYNSRRYLGMEAQFVNM